MKRYLRAAFVLVLLGGLPAFAYAHAFPQHSSPGAGDSLRKPPTQVRILFDDPLEPAFSHVTVKNAKGKVVSGKSRVVKNNAKLLEAALPPLAPGSYHVYWSVVSRDSHHTEGDYRFTVK